MGEGKQEIANRKQKRLPVSQKEELFNVKKCSREGLNICVILIYKRDKFDVL